MEISFFMARLTDDEKNVDLQLELKEWARFMLTVSYLIVTANILVCGVRSCTSSVRE